MSLRANIDKAAFDALADTTVIGKDSFRLNEKDNQYYLDLAGEEAAKLAIPLQEKVAKLETNNAKLLDEKIKATEKATKFEKLGKTPEELEKFLKENRTEDAEALEKKYQDQTASIQRAADAEVKSVRDELAGTVKKTETLTEQIRNEMKRTKVAELKNKFDMNALGDDWLANRIAVVPEEEGSDRFVVRVVENGDLAYKAGKLKTPEELAEEARQNRDLAGMFNAGSGGGSGGTNNQSGDKLKRPGTVLGSDQDALSANMEQIASGEVKVVG